MSDESVPVTEETPGSAGSSARPGFSLSLRARDLLNVAIFAVIYLVVVFAINMLGLINPLVMFLALLLSTVVAGIPFMLFLTRVKRAGMVTLFGALLGLVLAITGLGWITLVVAVLVSVIAEAILWTGRYRSRWAAIWACTVFSLSSVGPFIPLLIEREAYLSSPTFQANGAEYVEAFDQLATLPLLGGYVAATLLCGLLGGLLGAAMLRKHFVRAGLA